MKELTFTQFCSCATFLMLLHCVASGCSTARDCYPNINGFDSTVSENLINCTDKTCVCNICFYVGSDESCTLRDGCWELVFSERVIECRMKENGAIFTTVSGVLFGVSAVIFIVPLVLAGVLGLTIVVFYKRCSKKEIPDRIITPVIVGACACSWTVSLVLVVAGIIHSVTSESSDNPTCLQ